MKKVTKFLSILLLVAMCMSLFGGSAYAVELEGGNTSSSAPTVVNDGVQLNGDDTYLDGGSSSGAIIITPRSNSDANMIDLFH